MKNAWRGALAFFILAGVTGAFFRFVLVSGHSWGFELGNIRHAHSHTMYFGWVTPALMALIASRLPELGGRVIPKAAVVIAAAFLTAFLAYPPFILSGYGYVAIGEARLPISMIAAGLNVIAWYAFVVMYIGARRGAPSSLPLRFFDLALMLLVLATVGAWGLPILIEVDPNNQLLKTALTHFFLDLFSEGWFVLAVLGLAAAEARLDEGAKETRKAALGVVLAAVGIPFAFVLGMTPELVPQTSMILARLGGLITVVGLMLVIATLWARDLSILWRFALGALAVKLVGQAVVAIVPGINWAGMPQLRVLYLHVMLLGFVSVGLVAGARAVYGDSSSRGRTWFGLSVAIFLASLVPLTPVWPIAWRGIWVLWMVALVAIGPVLVAVRMIMTRK